jgi:hypothetical protein
MGLIRTLVDYGQQAYEGLKPPGESKAAKPQNQTEDEINYPQIKLSGRQPVTSKPRVELKAFQQQIGQDSAQVQNTLRQKLAEYGLPSHTRIQALRDPTGSFKIAGNINPEIARKIEFDLNQNPDFKQQFLRLEQQQPTLDYLQNIMRISSAYGGENQVLNSLLSANPANNSLHDISQRFDRLHKVTDYQHDSVFDNTEPHTVNRFSVAV